jgi:hypothetical protein
MRFTLGTIFLVGGIICLIGFVTSFFYEGLDVSDGAKVTVAAVRKQVLGIFFVMCILQCVYMYWDPDGNIIITI